jgi:hypothetical protein
VIDLFFKIINNPNLNRLQERLTMNMSRRLGILVFCMVPAIIGGGIVYGIFSDYVPVFVYEAILIVVAGALVSR